LPEAIPRYLTLWLLSALLACLVVRRPPQPARRLGHLAFVVILAAAPALHSRYLPCDERGLAPLAHQEGVKFSSTTKPASTYRPIAASCSAMQKPESAW
jgi:hypothetical protein